MNTGKQIVRMAAVALLLGGLSLPASAATSVIQVEDDVVRLGQIFHNIGAKEDIIVGSAPRPGQDMVLNSRRLLQLARANGVKWSPGSTDDQVILRRTAASGITADAQMQALKDALSAKGAGAELALNLDRQLMPIRTASGTDQNITVDNLSFNPQTNGFSAVLVMAGKSVKVSGFVTRMVSVPALKAPLQKGLMVSASDITFITVSADALGRGSITDADSLIGKIASHTLEPGKPLRSSDINEQQLVTRGQEVDIVFAQGPMQLRARGKAMQHGTSDDLVKVVNLSSNKTFDARVTGDGEVTVY